MLYLLDRPLMVIAIIVNACWSKITIAMDAASESLEEAWRL